MVFYPPKMKKSCQKFWAWKRPNLMDFETKNLQNSKYWIFKQAKLFWNFKILFYNILPQTLHLPNVVVIISKTQFLILFWKDFCPNTSSNWDKKKLKTWCHLLCQKKHNLNISQWNIQKKNLATSFCRWKIIIPDDIE